VLNLKEQSPLKHIAVIMDGNGRWAQQRHRPRVWGHIRGAHVVSEIVEAADEAGVSALTLYAFSTENWSRPVSEVKVLFALLKKFVQRERNKIIRNQVRFRVIGDITHLPAETQKLVTQLEQDTSHHCGLKLTFAFSYGGRDEILKAFQKMALENKNDHITEEMFNQYLMTHDCGDVDLLIRTGGEMRVSNFLLWQLAYAELYFSKTQWPDFTSEEFKNILSEVSKRQRRFGFIQEGFAPKDIVRKSHEHKDYLSLETHSERF
jgi:undecaprenyl diphosphate synthase